MPIYRLPKSFLFPDPREAEPEGILAVGGGLEPERLLLAYGQGIFPWYAENNPILWWSPDPRLVLYPDQVHVSKSLERVLAKPKYQVTLDQAFGEVIAACAQTKREGQDGTWILEDMQAAYTKLHHLGYAHSVETWEEGRLVGGLYGVSLGAAFFGESMFSHRPDASKAALVRLCRQLELWGFELVDCQVPTSHLKSMGAQEVPRETFLEQLEHALQSPHRLGPWSFDGLQYT
ncbi:MAG: leucyl/phenylalanyl-tRNA--protein transferase [Candidatus Lambdaproteobacteria bacterium RIFOXYD1_FULL_56_27]|uniref:Leucyl/phenylalanyl-tRNA--protein transferase n=1 Tax=Candidatus Lambdaproteobacteria bacterium RIFOXYD2_FULL_56_26 TaxID=1817773 RepID=A0A1F6GQK0_9PROT|nr:MAG: leucyl/phenylalanyl-tRNA--protein transferase [Candidatus Lambdaproteobacteria bacterium RIFOXYD2_FULL_56_26]OGH04147.1 MAG: leucyl/phenylalanyl-tRNA--protein transferase [Candidatus Lambdaproteobacteria bacterium RIFOXYC1_FULL_56_13]OGH06336.1 MAG: leucyl/phenylalanyl-tRNA--protein transferase [Candidatus Lambdaproteobacteria bacterium RIFOXYD1_FULL_56_27]